jgi:hypothetical protein
MSGPTYTIDGYTCADGRILGPGKFEGCPDWAPHFWGKMLNGGASAEGNDWAAFVLHADDYAAFPDLAGHYGLVLKTDDNGFVYTQAFTCETTYNVWVGAAERNDAEGCEWDMYEGSDDE